MISHYSQANKHYVKYAYIFSSRRRLGFYYTVALLWLLLHTTAEGIYCAFARNSADSAFFVPFFLTENSKMAPINMTGKWKLDRSENFEDFLKAVDVGFLARKIALAITPVHEIEQTDDAFIIKVTTPRGTQEMSFKIGDEFIQNVLSYQGDFKCVASWEGSALALSYEPVDPKKKQFKETREIIDNEYVLTVYIGEVVCKRIFKRAQ